MAPVELKRIVDLTPELLHLPSGRMWTSYDQEADVLYINFKKPSHADDSELLENDVLVRYEQGEVVGIPVLNASRRAGGALRLARLLGIDLPVGHSLNQNPASDNLLDHAAVHLCQAFLAAQMQVAELVLVEAELMKHGGVDIAEVHGVFDGA